MCDVIDDRLRADGKARGMQSARISAITGRPAVILPGGPDPDDIKAADMLRASIDQHGIDLNRYLVHAMTGSLRYGWAVSEQMWQWVPSEGRYDVTALYHIRSRYTRISTSTNVVPNSLPDSIAIQTGAHEHQVEAQIPGKYIEVRGSYEDPAVWSGIGVTSTIWSTMKMQTAADNLVLLKRYGIPFLEIEVGDWTSESDKATARNIARTFGRDGSIIKPKNAKIAITIHDGLETARVGTSGPHEQFWNRCDDESAVVWLGSSYATQSGSSGSSYALAREQGNVSFRLTLSDRERVQQATNKQWFEPWMRYNGFKGRTPKLQILVERVENPQVAVEMAKGLSEVGYAVDPGQLQELTGMRQDPNAKPEPADKPDDTKVNDDV